MFPSVPWLHEAISLPFKRSQLGLFHGKSKQYGNNVPFSKKKTRRSWLPNVQNKRIYSETLDQKVRLKITTKALRSTKKAGGLDNYLTSTRHELIGLEGMRLRLAIRDQAEKNAVSKKAQERAEMLQTPEGQEMLRQRERQKLLNEHQKTLRRFQNGPGPTLAFARSTRELAAKALGLTGLASAQQTIKYLESQRRALATPQA